jgi:hypothetical protein
MGAESVTPERKCALDLCQAKLGAFAAQTSAAEISMTIIFAFGSPAVGRCFSEITEVPVDPWLSALPFRKVRLFQARVT